jgi:hypothetical protein
MTQLPQQTEGEDMMERFLFYYGVFWFLLAAVAWWHVPWTSEARQILAECIFVGVGIGCFLAIRAYKGKT